jgi:hypothetical protein
MDGYSACCLYRAMRLHFNTDYNFIKYNGKVKYPVSSFNINKHKYAYDKLAKKYSDEELKQFYLANFVNSENVWIQDLLCHEAQDIYIQFAKRNQSLSYIFENDLLNIFDIDDHSKLFKCDSKEFPVLLTKLMRNEICIETVIIMNKFLKFVCKWDKSITDDICWPNIRNKLIKYEPFLEYDKIKFKTSLIKRVEEFK